MTVFDRLEGWRTSGAITSEQYTALTAIARGDKFSVFVELNVLLYLGVLACIAGIAWTVQEYFSSLGDATILIVLTMLCGGAFYYCFAKAPPFTSGRMESPSLAFDYILYLGALVFGIEIGYIESRFQLLQSDWDYYLLLSAAVLFPIAYRFDNRLVLSLALSSLAGWFGLSLSRYGIVSSEGLRVAAMAYAAIVAVAGLWLSRRAQLKEHFLRTYLHVAANAMLLALLSGAVSSRHRSQYLAALLIASAVAVYGGIRFSEFAFAAYGTLYGYAGISARVLDSVRAIEPALVYFIMSGVVVVGFLAWLTKVGRRP